MTKERRQEVREFVRDNYLTTPARTIASRLGITPKQVYSIAHNMELRLRKERITHARYHAPKYINPMVYFICDNWTRGLRYWKCLTH